MRREKREEGEARGDKGDFFSYGRLELRRARDLLTRMMGDGGAAQRGSGHRLCLSASASYSLRPFRPQRAH